MQTRMCYPPESVRLVFQAVCVCQKWWNILVSREKLSVLVLAWSEMSGIVHTKKDQEINPGNKKKYNFSQGKIFSQVGALDNIYLAKATCRDGDSSLSQRVWIRGNRMDGTRGTGAARMKLVLLFVRRFWMLVCLFSGQGQKPERESQRFCFICVSVCSIFIHCRGNLPLKCCSWLTLFG